MSGLTLASLKPSDLTWDTAVRLFTLRCKSQNLSPRTLGLYAASLGQFRRWLTENNNPSPSEVQAGHLRAYLDSIKSRGASDATVDCSYRILRTLWGFLLSDGLTLLNPMAKVERPRREKRFVKPITEHQLKATLSQIDTRDILGQRDYALITFLADTGLRLGEALAIRLNDIDWASNSVTVFGKGRKERRVAFGRSVRTTLMSWVRRRGGTEGTELLFPNRYGEPLSTCTVDQRMKGYTRAAGIAADRLSPHALRHFFALTFLRNGGDVMALQKLLGHTSLDMVRNYVNMTDDDALAKHRQASPLDRMGPLPNERKRVKLI